MIISRNRSHNLLTVSATIAGMILLATSRPAVAEVTSAQVQSAVRDGVRHLRRTQAPGGTWSESKNREGLTALNLLAMVNAGVPPSDRQVAKGLRAMKTLPNRRTYAVSLKCQLYAAIIESLPPDQQAVMRKDLQKATDFLVQSQLRTGMWTYVKTGGRGDNSNTQFALLGLHEAAKAGVKVPETTWRRAAGHFLKTQNKGGGWGYRPKNKSYGSMTTAGLASLYICGHRMHVNRPRAFKNGQYLYCGKYVQNAAVAAGGNWISRNFSVTKNPGTRNETWLYYYLYGLERVGMISGRRFFGSHEWYRQGAEFLVNNQRRDGNWGRSSADTAFAVLFLAKGNRPVLIQKLRWKGAWNRNIHDLENLTAFIDDKLGKKVSWQATSLDLPIEELRQGPILFITGHEFPRFTDDQKQKLRRFVESGGTLLAEACCGKAGFAEGFRALMREMFPEYRLRPLGPKHPVFASYYDLDKTYELEGMDVGCRTSVFFSPRALSSLWELQTVPQWSEFAMKLGVNIAAYATGKEQLPDRLDVVKLPAAPKRAAAVEVPRGAVRIARLVHQGDYKADTHAMVNLAELLRTKAGADVVAQERHLQATDPTIYEYPVIFMTGHFSFDFSEEELKALREYLQRGGFLFAEPCCGREEFDTSFRQLAARLFPDAPLEPLPDDHPIYAGQVGQPLGELKYRQVLADQLNSRGTSKPPLEAVTLDGRTVILYSKYDFSCALEGDNPYSCRGYVDEDGQKLAMAILLYAIGY